MSLKNKGALYSFGSSKCMTQERFSRLPTPKDVHVFSEHISAALCLFIFFLRTQIWSQAVNHCVVQRKFVNFRSCLMTDWLLTA